MTQNVGGGASNTSFSARILDQMRASRTTANELNAAEKDGNNTVTKDSVTKLMEDQWIPDGISQEDRQMIQEHIENKVAEYDTNGDGEFDEAEFDALYMNEMMPQSERVASLTRQEKPWPFQQEVQEAQGGINAILDAAGIELPPGDYPPGPPIAVDGKFGPQTEAAIKAVQELWGMEPTGVADPAFLARLANGGEPLPVIETSVNAGAEAAAATLAEGLEQEVPAAFLDEFGQFDHEAYAAAEAHWRSMAEALEALPADHPERAAFEEQLAAKQGALAEAKATSESDAAQVNESQARHLSEFEGLLAQQPVDYAAIEARMAEVEGIIPPERFQAYVDLVSSVVQTEMQTAGNYDAAKAFLNSGFPLEYLNPDALLSLADNIVIKHDRNWKDGTIGEAEYLQRVTNALLDTLAGKAALNEWAMTLTGDRLNRFIDFISVENTSTQAANRLSELSVATLTHLQNAGHDGEHDKDEKLGAALEIAIQREAAEAPPPATTAPTGGGGGGGMTVM